MRHLHTLIAFAFLGVASSGNAGAAALGLTLADSPDIVSGFIDVAYSAASDTLTASGFALELDDDGTPPSVPIDAGSFSLSATVDDTGTLLGGSLTIGGTIPSLGAVSGTLLTGTITKLGADGATGLVEFLLDVTGGDLASLYGAVAGGILGTTGFTGSWDSDFSASGASADVAAIPLPAALWLLLPALLTLVRRR